jgi:hypothetical protein
VPLKLILEFMPSGQHPNDVCEQLPCAVSTARTCILGPKSDTLFNKTKISNMTAKIIINDLSIYIF